MNPTSMGVNDPSIYKKATKFGKYGEWSRYDFIELFEPLLRTGTYLLSSRGTIVRNNRGSEGLQYETPWYHQKTHFGKQCYIDNVIKFGHLGYIPPKCLECWKVVVAPRTLKELMLLKDVEADMDVPSKCGIELRAYTSKPYGGYFYNDSLDEGRDRYYQVRDAVDEHISKDVKVILKRGCTEYEMLLGNSLGWHITPENLKMDEKVEAYIDCNTKHHAVQPPMLANHIMKRWVEYAHKIGDETYKEYTMGQNLYPDYQTYHDQDPNDMKVAMVAARAKKLYDVDPKVTQTVLSNMARLNETTQTDRKMIGTIMGFHHIDPFSIYEFGAI